MKKHLLIITLVLMLVVPGVLADIFVVNSKDWRDVYTAHIYSSYTGNQVKFLVSDKHGPIMINEIPKEETVKILSSSKRPFVIGYESMLKSGGIFDVTEIKYENLNLEIAEELDTVENFIVADDNYGYNSIAIAPYAALTKSYVLFANKDNINQIVNILENRNVKELIIYGQVDREVLESLEEYNPDIINEGGDRYANNIEIVKRFKQIRDARQVVLTNGEFIETEIMNGLEPVLFIGNQNVPLQIRDYIQNSDIEVGVLIGNELVGTATTVRRQAGISTFVKFARGARVPAGAVSKVEGLDRFPVPKVTLDLQIVSIKYNKVTKKLEITFKSNAEIVTYLRGTYTLTVGDQEFVLGDENPVFIDKNMFKTIVYDVEGLIPEDGMKLNAYIVFGESKNSLEFIIDQEFDVSTVEVSDNAQIEIKKLEYDKTKLGFFVFIENIGDADAYVQPELIDLIVVGQKQDYGAEEILELPKGKIKSAFIPVEMDDKDLNDNPFVKIRAFFGEREGALVKIIEGEFEISIKSFDVWTYVPVAVILILVLLFIFGRKKCSACGEKNPRGRKTCKKCHHKLK